jgi:hypothetical protein
MITTSSCCTNDGEGWRKQERGGGYYYHRTAALDAGSLLSMEDTTNLLAEELQSLSVSERERVYSTIHGVPDIIEETPELVRTSLSSMRYEITDGVIPKHRRKALDRAFFLKPSFATDDSFHLMFLRSERFDAKEAASKMCAYFQHKQTLFGEDKLVKRITLEDMGEKEMVHMHAGYIQTPVINQRGDHAILFMTAANEDMSDWKAVTRYQWYQMMTLAEDEDVQKRGATGVVSFHGPLGYPVSQILNWARKAGDILKDWPVREAAIHLCYDHPALDGFLRMMQQFQGKEYRLHTRTHCGSLLEAQYSLVSFGIRFPPHYFTLGEQSHAQRQTMVESYLAERRRIEQEEEQLELLDQDGTTEHPFLFPGPNDVLMGRGRSFQDWQGNLRLVQIVGTHLDRYVSSDSKSGKTAIATEIVLLIESTGKFLERTETTGWVILSDQATTRKKVSQIFRAEARKRGQGLLSTTSRTGGAGTGTSTAGAHSYSTEGGLLNWESSSSSWDLGESFEIPGFKRARFH